MRAHAALDLRQKKKKKGLLADHDAVLKETIRWPCNPFTFINSRNHCLTKGIYGSIVFHIKSLLTNTNNCILVAAIDHVIYLSSEYFN